MFTGKEMEILQKEIVPVGEETISDLVIYKMSELTDALLKKRQRGFLWYESNYNKQEERMDIIEKTADVLISIELLNRALHNGFHVNDFVHQKIRQMGERIEGEK